MFPLGIHIDGCLAACGASGRAGLHIRHRVGSRHLGDTAVPYNNGGQLAAPGDPHPLIGSPDLGNLTNPKTMLDRFDL